MAKVNTKAKKVEITLTDKPDDWCEITFKVDGVTICNASYMGRTGALMKASRLLEALAEITR